MESDIQLNDLFENFLKEIKDLTPSDGSFSNYFNAIRTLQNYALKTNQVVYTDELMSSFEDSYRKRYENKEICWGYFRFLLRVIRLFTGFAATGTIDYSRGPLMRIYPVSPKEEEEIKAILDQSNIPEGSRNDIEGVLRHLFVYGKQFGEMPACVTDDILLNFYLKELPKTNEGSMGRSLRAIKIASEAWKKKGFDLTLDFTQLHVPGRNVKHINPYLPDEVEKLINITDDSPSGIRNRAIILLGYECALRGVDIRSLKLSDIDWKNKVISLTQSKTHHPITIPMTGRVMNALADYILKIRPENTGYKEVFLTVKGHKKPLNTGSSNFNTMLTDLEKRADIDKQVGRSFHSLRRGWASQLSAVGVDIELISQLLGHQSIKEERPYLTYNCEQISFCAIGFEEIPLTLGIYGNKENENDVKSNFR